MRSIAVGIGDKASADVLVAKPNAKPRQSLYLSTGFGDLIQKIQ
jgi:hypothetical protein